VKNEESHPARWLPGNSSVYEPSGRIGGGRAWAREVRNFSDEELLRCVRAQVAVDRAVNTYRSSAATPIRFDVPS
jgi:hypothetical protein